MGPAFFWILLCVKSQTSTVVIYISVLPRSSPYNRPRGPRGRIEVQPYSSFNPGTRWGWVVNATPRPLYPRERPGTHCIGGWVGLGAGVENLAPTGIRSPDHPARSDSLYRLSYPGPHLHRGGSLKSREAMKVGMCDAVRNTFGKCVGVRQSSMRTLDIALEFAVNDSFRKVTKET